jgi:hypothetical protein
VTKDEARIFEKPVLLRGVAPPTCSDDVLPRVRPTAAAGNDVIDVLGLGSAVLAAVTVASKNGSASDRDPSLAGNLHIVGEADDRGLREGHTDRTELVCRRMEDLGFVAEDKDERTTRRHDTDWFIGRVEHECSSEHRPPTEPYAVSPEASIGTIAPTLGRARNHRRSRRIAIVHAMK